MGPTSWLGQAIPGPWKSWTPTWTNVTTTGATIVAQYVQIGKTVHYFISLTFGASTAITGNARVSLPVASVTYPQYAQIGYGSANNSGGAVNPLAHCWISTTAAEIFCSNTSSTYDTYNFVTGSAPFSWGTGDILYLQGTYQAA